MKKVQNPDAFPNEFYENSHRGMTLRDYFADSASKVVPINCSGKYTSTNEDYDAWAKECYKRADALLKQREYK